MRPRAQASFLQRRREPADRSIFLSRSIPIALGRGRVLGLLVCVLALWGPARAAGEVPDAGVPSGGKPQAVAVPPPGADVDPVKFRASLPGTDVTDAYDALYGQAEGERFPPQRRARLSRYQAILVPGWLTHLYLRVGKFVEGALDKEGVLNYLEDEQQALSELGLPAEQPLLDRKQFNTQQTIAVNAQRIVRAVLDAAAKAKGRQVILISHSKGGNDVLAALLALQRAGKLRHVAGWISIQSVFLGSPVADVIMESAALHKAADVFLKPLGGTVDSIRDISSPACARFLAENKRDLARLVRGLPIVSFASWKPRPEDFRLTSPDSILATTRDLMAGKGLLSDGLVPAKNAVLADTAFVAKLGLDHSETAMQNQPPVQPSRLDRKRFTQALLALLLERIDKRAAPEKQRAAPQEPATARRAGRPDAAPAVH
ncbi:MAG: hypothetical protein U1A78_14095 [Polyangia bacterium]